MCIRDRSQLVQTRSLQASSGLGDFSDVPLACEDLPRLDAHGLVLWSWRPCVNCVTSNSEIHVPLKSHPILRNPDVKENGQSTRIDV